ncbi:MAG: hypothetical protein EBU66_16050 [Bacteroidetes bacterium]|nr:hypothetical protein [Bacteroidota bacterium]
MKFRFIITSSINTPEREITYVSQIKNSISVMKDLPFEVYLVENNGMRETVFDELEGLTLVYTGTNSIRSFERKGMKEFHDLFLLADTYDFDDEDIIIKLTGLYTLSDATFLKSVVELESQYDAFIKWYDVIHEKYVYDDCCLGLYAIRYKYLNKFNYIEMLQHPSMEHVFAKYVREEVPANRIMEATHLGLLRENNKQLV